MVSFMQRGPDHFYETDNTLINNLPLMWNERG